MTESQRNLSYPTGRLTYGAFCRASTNYHYYQKNIKRRKKGIDGEGERERGIMILLIEKV